MAQQRVGRRVPAPEPPEHLRGSDPAAERQHGVCERPPGLLDGRLVVEGRSVQVQYDFAAKTSVPLDEVWRRLIEDELRG